MSKNVVVPWGKSLVFRCESNQGVCKKYKEPMKGDWVMSIDNEGQLVTKKVE